MVEEACKLETSLNEIFDVASEHVTKIMTRPMQHKSSKVFSSQCLVTTRVWSMWHFTIGSLDKWHSSVREGKKYITGGYIVNASMTRHFLVIITGAKTTLHH